jgi:hypothetical protein
VRGAASRRADPPSPPPSRQQSSARPRALQGTLQALQGTQTNKPVAAECFSVWPRVALPAPPILRLAERPRHPRAPEWRCISTPVISGPSAAQPSLPLALLPRRSLALPRGHSFLNFPPVGHSSQARGVAQRAPSPGPPFPCGAPCSQVHFYSSLGTFTLSIRAFDPLPIPAVLSLYFSNGPHFQPVCLP